MEPSAGDGRTKNPPAGRQPVPPRDNSNPPQWALVIVAGTIFIVGLLFQASELPRFLIPFDNPDFFYIGLIFLPMIVLVIVAVAVKILQVRKAKGWAQTSARIVKSNVKTQHHRFPDDEETVKNVPEVEYEFSALGQTWRGNRIGIGDDSGGANTEATLKRYPVGATVAVYYDPEDPANCVIERDAPAGMAKGCAQIVLAIVSILALGYFAVTEALYLLATHLPRAEAPVVVFASCFGLAVLVFFFGAYRASRQAKGWPSVRGQIVSSTVDQIESHEDGRTTYSYAPAVEYAYRVDGNHYRSRQIEFGLKISGSQSHAQQVAARYPAGSAVEVHYDPGNPSNAALKNSGRFNWVLLLIALFCFGVAFYASNVLR